MLNFAISTLPLGVSRWFSSSRFSYFIHSSLSLSYNRTVATSKVISPNSAIWCLSSSCLGLLPRLNISSVLPSLFPTVTCFRAVSTQDVTNSFSPPSFCCMQYIPLLLDYKSDYLIFHTISPTDVLHLSPAPHFKTYQVFHV
jgi:hypothetical protein